MGHENLGRNGVWTAALTIAAVVGAEPLSSMLSFCSCFPYDFAYSKSFSELKEGSWSPP